MHSKGVVAYLFVIAAALAAGLAVAAGVSIVIGDGSAGLPPDAAELVDLVLPAAAGLAVVILTVELGLRHVGRPRAKSGW